MIVSYNWLQSFFKDPLPQAREVADKLLLHSFEIEGFETLSDDFIIDIDVLPNRAGDCLCHFGVAGEIGTLFSLSLKNHDERYPALPLSSTEQSIAVEIQDKELCGRYVVLQLAGVKNQASPEWLVKYLEAIGQRSINIFVDATNYVMFDLGQPTHVFDADKVAGRIIVRLARQGENITLLSGEKIMLDNTMLIIADNDGPLAIAGVKGGSRAEVDENTKNIIIESANFNSLSVRRTRHKLGIVTDASKRFENSISSTLCGMAADAVARIITLVAATDTTKIFNQTDENFTKTEEREIYVSVDQVNSLLGANLQGSEIANLLSRLNFKFESIDTNFKISPPALRNDLQTPEDIIEEIGRVYGYDKLQASDLRDITFVPKNLASFTLEQRIRNYLTDTGYSEVETNFFSPAVGIEVLNPVAQDAPYIRTSLLPGLGKALERNVNNAELFGVERIKIFEYGRIIDQGGIEHFALGVGLQNITRRARKEYGAEADEIRNLLSDMMNTLNLLDTTGNIEYTENVAQIVLQTSTSSHNEIEYPPLHSSYNKQAKFHQFSQYPFIVRDISLWAPDNFTQVDFEKQLSSLSVPVERVDLVDRFEKDGRQSLSFRIIFQSDDRTLENTEVNDVMSELEKTLSDAGCEIR